MSSRDCASDRPNPVYAATWHLYRDLSKADEICNGRFSHSGESVQVGTSPDWNGEPISDEEWGIEWNKFYFGLELANAFDVTGDRVYLETWESLVASWIDQDPRRHRSSDVTARRIQNWLFAWDRFARSRGFPGLREGLSERLMSSIGSQTDEVRDGLTRERNHRTLELTALALVGMALPQCDSRGDLLEFTTRELEKNLLEDILPDGVHRERSTHYHMIVLRNFLTFRENARRFGVPVSCAFDERLSLACDFALHMTRPDGTIPMLSDSDGGSYGELLALAALLLKRPELSCTRGRIGTQAARASFPNGGYFVSRSSWSNQAAYLLFDCGPLGDGGHGHYDALHVEIFAKGRPLVVDPGRYTYDESGPNWRRWFKGTRAHNTVSVDGLDQTPYRRGKPKGPVAQASLIRRDSAATVDSLLGEVESPNYDAVHRRRVVTVGAAYWVIVDSLRAPSEHDYDLRFHLDASVNGAVRVERKSQSTRFTTDTLTLEISRASSTDIETGWVAPAYGVKSHAPVISCRQVGRDCDFVTLLSARRGREILLEDASVRPNGSGYVRVRLEPEGLVTDVLAWGDHQTRDAIVVEGRAFEGHLVWLRSDRGGEPRCEVAGEPWEQR